jgi:16S rRNA (guanine527-N7)-methyltransferase
VFHVKHDEIAAAAAAIDVPLDRRQLNRLNAYQDLLAARAVPMGIVSPTDASVLCERHILDSLRAANIVLGPRVVDIGSGAGLPGIVVAIARPDATIYLVESRRRRAAFLELAVEQLELSNATPVAARIEEIAGAFDTALARAFADARASWITADRVLRSGGRLVYFAGARFQAEPPSEAGVRAEVVPPPRLLASSGPLVIMSRH